MNPYENRKYVIGAIIILIGLIFLIRLFSIQILSSEYKESADNNSMRYVTQYPARGLIYDRNNVLMVFNEAAYDLMVIPRQLKSFDTLELAEILHINKETILKQLNAAKHYSYYKPSIFIKQISSEDYANIQEKLYRFPGFYAQTRTLRKYQKNSSAHILGYVGEVNEKIIQSDPYYRSGDYIGTSGIEKSYEEVLRGKKGVKIFLVDVHNRIKGQFADGLKDTIPEVGADIRLTIDAKLQEYGELLMQNKIGSIVAIEPSTGEILALVSNPSYDPNLLVGRIRSENYTKLKNDSLKPLFNRATQAGYPPGSVFKLVQASIALQEKIITPEGQMHVEPYPNMNDHSPAGSYDVHRAIMVSSNWYFAKLYYKIIHRGKKKNRFEDAEAGFDIWYSYVLKFGIGKKLGTDIPGELSGNVPSNAFYDKRYGDKSWKASTIISNAIGQGEMLVVPIQMANIMAIIANKGYYYIPHLIKSIGDTDTIPSRFREKVYCGVDSMYFNVIQDAMADVVKNGTGGRAYLTDIEICGKTGTAENPHGEDHSVFVAFAPKENPKIAIAVYIENAGFGGTWAAPVTSLMIEKYLKDSISDPAKEERILIQSFMK